MFTQAYLLPKGFLGRQLAKVVGECELAQTAS